MGRYASIRGHKRSFFLLPYIPVEFMALGIGLITPVPHLIARALVGGLSHDSIVTQKNAHEIYPEVNLINFESATKDALTRLHPLKIERVWEDGEGDIKTLKHEGFFIDYRKIKVDAELEKLFKAVTKFAKHFEMRQFVVDTVEPNHLLLLRSQLKTPGQGWVEWRIDQSATPTYITQTIFLAPRGLAGFLYWYFSCPFRVLSFHRLTKTLHATQW
jgi:hypothetical protein